MDAQKKKMIYYFPQKDAASKRHLWNTVKLPVMEINIDDEWQMVCCMVPEYYMKNRSWDNEILLKTLNDVLTGQEFQQYYMHPALADKTGIDGRLPPDILLKKVLARVPCWEYLFYIGSSGEDNYMRRAGMEDETKMLAQLLQSYLARINHFTMITDTIEGYEEFAENIYEEYGIPTACMERMEKRCGKEGRTVILDGRRDYRIPYPVIPSGAVYVDFWSVEEKRLTLEKMRRDVRYVSVVKFLDTIVKNGYNTVVNQTYLQDSI